MTLTPCDFDPGVAAGDPLSARYTLAKQVFASDPTAAGCTQ